MWIDKVVRILTELLLLKKSSLYQKMELEYAYGILSNSDIPRSILILYNYLIKNFKY